MSEPGCARKPFDPVMLIRAIAAHGDRDAFATLFRHFAPRVKRWMLRAGMPDSLADDLAQETMLTVWRKAALYDSTKAGASTWVFTIARNLRIDSFWREHRLGETLPDSSDAPADLPQPDGLLAKAERDGRLRNALDTLSLEQAEVVRLAFFQDKPHAEIERELGIPLGTVKSRLRKAMACLRKLLEELE